MNRTRTATLLLALAALPLGAADVELLSRIPPRLATETANGGSRAVALSADGRFLVFLSTAPNLVAGVTDTNRGDDVFLHDRATGETVLVSRSTRPEPATADQASRDPAISADGRFVAFSSGALDLVPGQAGADGQENVFLWDRVSEVVELVSHAPGSESQAAEGQSFLPSLSADGRFVAFQSHATDLVNGLADRNGSLPDVFLYDRRTGRIALVSRSAASAGKTANSGSFDPVISADGRFVAFRSRATDLVSGQKDSNREQDFFLWDRTTGRTGLVSHAAADRTTAANGASLGRPFVSADGAFVAFLSRARNLVPGQSGLGTNVFLWARSTGAVTLVTHTPSSSTRSAGAASNLAGLSADGSWVLFNSTGRSLVPGQSEETGQPTYDVFLWSRQSEQIRLLSGAGGSATRTGNSDSFGNGLSADGSWAVLASRATDLVPGVRNSGLYPDVFLWSRRADRVELLSHAAESPDTGGGGESSAPLLSADGRVLAYTSHAPDLDAETRDTNDNVDVVLESRSGAREIVSRHAAGLASATPQRVSRVTSIDMSGRWVTFLSGVPSADVFLYDRTTRATTLVSHAAPQTAGSAGCTNAQISANGRFVAFLCSQLFFWDRETGVTTLISHAAGAPATASNREAGEVAVSADGAVVAFGSAASDLVPGQVDPLPGPDIFVWERATGTVSLLSGKAGSPTEAGDSSSFNPRMSSDGRIVVFGSFASDLVTDVTDSNERADIFVHDRTTGTTTLISRAADAPEAVGGEVPLVSADGRFVAFTSSFLTVPGQTGPSSSNLFLWDRETGALRLVPLAPPAVGGVVPVSVDLDAAGRFVTFASFSVEGGNTGNDVFLFDRESGATVLVSRAADSPGRTANGESDAPRISADGRIIVFASTSTDLAGDSEGPRGRNLFLYDRSTDARSLVTHSFRSPSRRSDGDTLFHVLAASGSAVAFNSQAVDLVPRDFNNLEDAFVAPLP
jgi:Tol biopolymer transport system component